MLSTAITLAAESSEGGDPVLHPYVVGAIALGILVLLLAAVVSFGGGREHS
jgi:uncharacterized protein (DUF2062 family)